MGLETVLERIRDTGRAEAAAIVAEARKERERLLAEARAEGGRLAARREAEAHEQAERRRVQDLARAELDTKKIVLAAQEEVLRAVRERVRQRLAASGGAESLRKLLAKNAGEWRSGRVYANARDAAAVHGVVAGSFAGTVECLGGVVIESADGTSRLDLTYDSILDDVWDDVVREVARTLWPTK
jgi:V/A-type H+-transporting ATPase subunit E